ncbi:biotin/lipoyl-binding protein [bacterium]|nr:biotin/lipoyl-binding protein [bacterium]
MSQVEFRLPELGDDAGNEATVSFWYYEEGEKVAKDEDIVELVTDKATFNAPSPAAGSIVAIRATDGAKVSVGDVLAIIETE